MHTLSSLPIDDNESIQKLNDRACDYFRKPSVDKVSVQIAIALLNKAFELDRTNSTTLINRVLAHVLLGSLQELDRAVREACETLHIFEADVFCKVGELLSVYGHAQEAELINKINMQRNPQHIPAYDTYGRLLLKCETELPLARKYLLMSFIHNRNQKHICHDLSVLYWKMGKFKKSLFYSRKSVARNPQNADAAYTHSVISLFNGDWQIGWDYFKARITRGTNGFIYSESLTESDFYSNQGRLVLYREQGVGDEIMFASMLLDLVKTNFALTVYVDTRLLPLFARSFPSVHFIGVSKLDYEPETHGHRVYTSYIGSLARYLRPAIHTFPTHEGYLKSDSVKNEEIKNRLKKIADNKFVVGITWRSLSPNSRRLRNIPLIEWGWLSEFKNICFVNAQFGDVSREISDFTLKTGIELVTFDDIDPMKDLDTFASLLSCCHLIIGIDNSTVHLSASLGIPTWIMLPLGCDYRWMQNILYSPWYPSVRLFRQSQFGDWNSVQVEVQRALKSVC